MLKKNRIQQQIRLITILSISILFIGCPGSKRDELQFLRNQIDSLRSVVNNFIIEENLLKYNAYKEQKPFQSTILYKKYKNLFSQKDIDLINSLLKLEQRPERVDRLERLKVFIYRKIVDKHTSHISDEIEKYKNNLFHKTRKGKIKNYELLNVLSNEPNQFRRKKIYNSALDIYKEIKKLNEKLIEAQKKIILDSLRFNNIMQFSAMVQQYDLVKFYNTVNNFIKSTDEVYFDLLYELQRINGFNSNKFYTYDIPRICKNTRLEKYFIKDSLLGIWQRTFSEMNFNLDSLINKQVIINSSNHNTLPTKAFIINIPDENILFINPKSGSREYGILFSETMKFLSWSSINSEFFEFKYLGSPTLDEIYSSTLNNLLDEPAWLKQTFNISERNISYFTKLKAFEKLYSIRRLSFQYLVEFLAIDSSFNDQKNFDKLFTSIMGIKPTETDFYSSYITLGDYLNEINQIQGLFIEAMLKTKIRDKLGNVWFKSKQLSEYFQEFWKEGKKITVDNFIREIDYFEIDPRFFINEVISMRNYSKKEARLN